jgi:hypothetical protein
VTVLFQIQYLYFFNLRIKLGKNFECLLSWSTVDILACLKCDARCFPDQAEELKRAVMQACNELIHNRDLLNELDSAVGDGDCGTTLTNGARG